MPCARKEQSLQCLSTAMGPPVEPLSRRRRGRWQTMGPPLAIPARRRLPPRLRRTRKIDSFLRCSKEELIDTGTYFGRLLHADLKLRRSPEVHLCQLLSLRHRQSQQQQRQQQRQQLQPWMPLIPTSQDTRVAVLVPQLRLPLWLFRALPAGSPTTPIGLKSQVSCRMQDTCHCLSSSLRRASSRWMSDVQSRVLPMLTLK
mmetsp:Transcript_44167/g.104550  ORF Transcript_44167/g.104550 Transcript_44167/m.104550 type:complete len:201 (-) Transcript_44167:212-814(-)